MKNFIWAFIFLLVLSACDSAEPVNTALNWTPEEQCQVWNKWSLDASDPLVTYAKVSTMPESYFMAPMTVGWARVTGNCPNDKMAAVYPRF